MTPKLILFDLGGVIVRWTGIEALSDLTGLSAINVKTKLGHSKICSAHERGLCDDDVFLDELIGLFKFNYTRPEMQQLWNSWVGAIYDGTEQALSELKKQYSIACLSNTNALHWAHLNAYFNCEHNFHKAYASHLINLAKPDPSCFQFVLDDLNIDASDVLFLDDSAANIETAKDMGMTAIAIDPALGALPALKNLQIIR